jgi:hypothetical protein
LTIDPYGSALTRKFMVFAIIARAVESFANVSSALAEEERKDEAA